MTPPVLFLIFNRPDLTQRVFQRIRAAAPQKLFIAADGPRKDHPADLLLCAQTRQIIKEVDWDCEVITLLRAENLGCGRSPSSAITWFFEQVESGIILEDDCLPDISFFRFCEELLERYRDDARIMSLSGTNIVGRWRPELGSYHFSNYGGIWGWASWRRAWSYYDYQMRLWAQRAAAIQCIQQVLVDPQQSAYRVSMFDTVYGGNLDAWDYQWSFAHLLQSGLSVVPSVNLISNIGFRSDATHTDDANDKLANMPAYALPFPLQAPLGIVADRAYDRQFFQLASPQPVAAKPDYVTLFRWQAARLRPGRVWRGILRRLSRLRAAISDS